MKMSDFQNLDFQNIGGWPVPIKVIAIAVLCLLILGAGWYFDTQNQQVALERARKQEVQLKLAFQAKAKKAANLDALKRQMADMKQSFGDMLRRLPNKTEVAALLVDISQQGLAAGLEFQLFKPGKEIPAEFYVELPIKIKVTGTYHEFGQFVSGVADLPRIVTLHDIHIVDASKSKNQKGEKLVMELTAKTYRYMDENEEGAK